MSNTELSGLLKIIEKTDFLLMPNSFIMATLDSFSVAFAGGVFFTLTVGTLVVLISFGAAVIYYKNSEFKSFLSWVYIALLFQICLIINIDGLCLIESLSCVVVPLFVFFLYGFFFGRRHNGLAPEKIAVHFIPVLFLAIVLMVTSLISNQSMFSDFRDSFLMSNKTGMTINNFYYKYTLYPARVFKPYAMQIPRVCSVETETETPKVKRIRKRLADVDYLVIPPEVAGTFVPDIKVRISGADVFLQHRGKTVVTTTVKSFISRPWKDLERFSKETDRYYNYRRLTSFALKSGFPLYMYILMHFLLCLFIRLLLSAFVIKDKSALIASVCCFVIGCMAFMLMYNGSQFEITRKTLASSLKSQNVRERIAGLKFAASEELDMSKYSEYDTRFIDNYIPEKYWYARAAGTSTDIATVRTLIKLLDDQHPNVACQALYGLGLKNNKSVVNLIIEKINKSENWYVQWYAYRALKRLKWTQRTNYLKKR